LVPANGEVDGKPNAIYHKHERHMGFMRMAERPYIEVDPSFATSMDDFIISFLLAEDRHRHGNP
ncbi:hypothetical protein M422DRAFT_266443, partial [Sphaerobolus stellatus SS14]